ncbi:Bacterial extracellular solute-binding protein, family 3 [Synechococcus sp. PCC 7335]|uniref:transporter substrate-binding domain-containing protein n=1 Tax=Synechococcus sp. (strain ATCC 29403 / PCC 7335) TaxID=91464 RepID=UPI00017ED9A8|nr:transporter substrate-binding domain-containing protein [Synechococcus sp. PCC 7335]EDX85663.1 Bacterial extracellular solute-binding protein, family 3 [Synechococcus sp. PCC 7335]
MKRRWFLVGLTLPFVSAGCRSAEQSNPAAEVVTEGSQKGSPDIDTDTLVMATTPNYPPYELIVSKQNAGDSAQAEPNIVGFDIDLARLIAARLGKQLSVIDLPFDELLLALTEGKADIAMAALAPSRSRKQIVDFSNIYYRSRHTLVSIDGYLRSRDLGYQAIGVHNGSVQARFAQRLTDELPGLYIEYYDSLTQLFDAVDVGEISGAIVEANLADNYLKRYADIQARVMPVEGPTGSAIALPQNSPLRRDINTALSDIKASGEMDQLIARWFGDRSIRT